MKWFLAVWLVFLVRCDVTPTVNLPPIEVAASKSGDVFCRLSTIEVVGMPVNNRYFVGQQEFFARYQDLPEVYAFALSRTDAVIAVEKRCFDFLP